VDVSEDDLGDLRGEKIIWKKKNYKDFLNPSEGNGIIWELNLNHNKISNITCKKERYHKRLNFIRINRIPSPN